MSHLSVWKSDITASKPSTFGKLPINRIVCAIFTKFSPITYMHLPSTGLFYRNFSIAPGGETTEQIRQSYRMKSGEDRLYHRDKFGEVARLRWTPALDEKCDVLFCCFCVPRSVKTKTLLIINPSKICKSYLSNPPEGKIHRRNTIFLFVSIVKPLHW